MSATTDRYPRSVSCKDGQIVVRPMEELDEAALDAFVQLLDAHDLLFLPRDLMEHKVRSAWLAQVSEGRMHSLVAERDGAILGTTALVVDQHSWSSHVGELRVLVAPGMKEQGLGRHLIQESFILGLDLGLEKLLARMTVDQESAIAVFQEMGFKPEALLRDHVRDSNGNKHDLVMLCHDVEQFESHMQAYGLTEAFTK